MGLTKAQGRTPPSRGRFNNKDVKEHCRLLISIILYFLKHPYGGVLMTAIGLGSNNGQFPLTYRVPHSKNEQEYSFFPSWTYCGS